MSNNVNKVSGPALKINDFEASLTKQNSDVPLSNSMNSSPS